jgi:hypothetical protein
VSGTRPLANDNVFVYQTALSGKVEISEDGCFIVNKNVL